MHPALSTACKLRAWSVMALANRHAIRVPWLSMFRRLFSGCTTSPQQGVLVTLFLFRRSQPFRCSCLSSLLSVCFPFLSMFLLYLLVCVSILQFHMMCCTLPTNSCVVRASAIALFDCFHCFHCFSLLCPCRCLVCGVERAALGWY